MTLSPGTLASAAPWTREAARLPIAFAQVREDAMLDQWVVQRTPERAAVLMVASGGCTAAFLAGMPRVARLHLIDPNPAQIALARLKLQLLTAAGPAERRMVLGHAPMSPAARSARLATDLQTLGLSGTSLGPMDIVATAGPDHAGRYELLFARLREALRDVEGELHDLLELKDPAEQSRRADPTTTLGRALDRALDEVMSLPNLAALFGEGATANRREPFARHFARRTRHVLASLPAAENPYLWQMYRGAFPEGALAPWLSLAPPVHRPEIRWTIATMIDALRDVPGEFDFIHLSNILDWLSPEEARTTLELAWKALRRGGWTLIRQLNSNLDIAALDRQFTWQSELTTDWHRQDRSFFYRTLHLGRKL